MTKNKIHVGQVKNIRIVVVNRLKPLKYEVNFLGFTSYKGFSNILSLGDDGMNIEVPKITDYIEVNELAKQVHELHVQWRPDLFLSVDNVINKEHYNEMIKNKEIYVAKIEDRIVGYITIIIKEKQNPSMRYRKQLDVEAMCIDENYRGKGIGTQLLNFAKQIGIENNCTDMYLTVNEENETAIKTYEKFGMRVKNIAYSMQL